MFPILRYLNYSEWLSLFGLEEANNIIISHVFFESNELKRCFMRLSLYKTPNTNLSVLFRIALSKFPLYFPTWFHKKNLYRLCQLENVSTVLRWKTFSNAAPFRWIANANEVIPASVGFATNNCSSVKLCWTTSHIRRWLTI